MDGREHIKITCDQINKDIKFFDDEFNKQFDPNELTIDVLIHENLQQYKSLSSQNKIPIQTSDDFLEIVNSIPNYQAASSSKKCTEKDILKRFK